MFFNSHLKPFLHDCFSFLLDVFFPKTCLGCSKEGYFFCPKCRNTVTKIQQQLCPSCKKPSPHGFTHPGCKTPQNSEGLICFFSYKDKKASETLIQAKYSFLPKAYLEFCDGLSKKIHSDFNFLLRENYIFTFVPLQKFRQRWRGFNQAEIICKKLAEDLNLTTLSTLKKVKTTKTQKDLKRENRLKNILGCFELLPETDVKDKNFILVDDVITTGATMNECVKILKRNGAKKVWCMAVARD